MSRTNKDYRALYYEARNKLKRAESARTVAESELHALEVQLNECEYQRDELRAELHTVRTRPLTAALAGLLGCAN